MSHVCDCSTVGHSEYKVIFWLTKENLWQKWMVDFKGVWSTQVVRSIFGNLCFLSSILTLRGELGFVKKPLTFHSPWKARRIGQPTSADKNRPAVAFMVMLDKYSLIYSTWSMCPCLLKHPIFCLLFTCIVWFLSVLLQLNHCLLPDDHVPADARRDRSCNGRKLDLQPQLNI